MVLCSSPLQPSRAPWTCCGQGALLPTKKRARNGRSCARSCWLSRRSWRGRWRSCRQQMRTSRRSWRPCGRWEWELPRFQPKAQSLWLKLGLVGWNWASQSSSGTLSWLLQRSWACFRDWAGDCQAGGEEAASSVDGVWERHQFFRRDQYFQLLLGFCFPFLSGTSVKPGAFHEDLPKFCYIIFMFVGTVLFPQCNFYNSYLKKKKKKDAAFRSVRAFSVECALKTA